MVSRSTKIRAIVGANGIRSDPFLPDSRLRATFARFAAAVGGWPIVVGLALLIVVATGGFFVRPTYPQYDSYYSLVWGREILDGHLPSLDAYRAPTEHPLAIAYGALLSVFGDGADRLLVLSTLVALVALAAGVYRIGQVAFTPLVGALAAVLVLTRFDFPYLAIRGYIDIPYLAIVAWAAALEIAKPRRGTWVFVLLAAAGLMRPEAWILSGLYFLYMAWRAPWRDRLKYAALTAFAPVVWVALDAVATGDPLFSFHSTRELAGELDRQRPLAEVPSAAAGFFEGQVKLPVVVLGLIGFGLGMWRFRNKMLVPTVLLFAGTITFLATAAAGLSAIPRYLLVPSVALCVLAALSLVGFAIKPRVEWWRIWAAGTALALVFGALYTVRYHPTVTKIEDELGFQNEIHSSFRQTLADPVVRDAFKRCGPLTVPTHKFVPEGRWILNARRSRVLARAQFANHGDLPEYGVAVFAFGRKANVRYGYAIGIDPLVGVPQPGFELVPSSRGKFTVAYVHCPRPA